MKRSLKASGLLSALSLSLFGVSVVGCSAEGTPAGEALGTTSQAHTTFTPTGTGVPTDLQFSGEWKLGASSILIIGGYNAAGNGQTTAGILKHGASTSTWTRLEDGSGNASGMPTGLGEAEVVQVATNTYLVAGGRVTRDGAASNKAWTLALSGASGNIAVWTAVNMSQARVIGKNNLQKCGSTGSRYIAIGGITDGSMDVKATSATDQVEIFDYKAGSSPAWNALTVQSSSPTKTVYLPQGQGYHEVLHVSDTDFRVVGGATASASAIIDVRGLQVTTNCSAALSTSVTTKSMSTTSSIINAATSLPTFNSVTQERARMSSIKASGTITVSGVAYDYKFILAGGNNNNAQGRWSTSLPAAILYYNPTDNAGAGSFFNNSTSARNLTDARTFPRFVIDDSNPTTTVKIGTGVEGNNTATLATRNLLYNTKDSTNTILLSTGVVSAGPTFNDSRVASAVQLFGNTAADYAAFGTNYVNGASTTLSNVEDF